MNTTSKPVIIVVNKIDLAPKVSSTTPPTTSPSSPLLPLTEHAGEEHHFVGEEAISENGTNNDNHSISNSNSASDFDGESAVRSDSNENSDDNDSDCEVSTMTSRQLRTRRRNNQFGNPALSYEDLVQLWKQRLPSAGTLTYSDMLILHFQIILCSV